MDVSKLENLFRVRNTAVRNLPADGMSEQPDINNRGESVVAQGLPERTEIVRLGGSFVKLSDAVACVTAIPTTAAPHYLWNGEPANGKSYVVDSLNWQCSTSAGAASMFSMLACLSILPVTAQPATADTAATVSTLNGRKYGGRAQTSHTVTIVDDKWWPLGLPFHSGALTATVGAQLEVPVNGLIIIPPGCGLSVAVLAVNTTALGRLAYRWHEVQLPVLI